MYEKIGFEKGQVLKAEHLNHIEDGVAKAVVGYEETVVKPAFDVTIPAGQGGSSDVKVDKTFAVEPGVTYPVTVNGKTFEVLCYNMEGEIHMGNGVDAEPYFKMETHPSVNYYFVKVYDPNGLTDTVDRRITIDIPVEETTVHTIEPKFLPGVCLPVVDFTGMNSGEITDETTIQLLNELADSGAPFLVKYYVERSGGDHRYRTALMIGYKDIYGSSTYESTQYVDQVVISKTDGVWSFSVSSGA